tara:strand:- start:558 stop:830 length:273 start_codon:yes stop_codon:yes gene_type:complete
LPKKKINQYQSEVKATSYLIDIDENKNNFYRLCIFFKNPVTNLDEEMHLNKKDSAALITQEGEDFFVDTDEVDAKIEVERQFINNTSNQN